MKILIVDDDKNTLDYLKKFFQGIKLNVFIADNALTGLDIIKKENPDIVLLDIRMEKMSGVEALREIKQFNKSAQIIIMTGSTDPNIKQQIIELGADDFIKKPFNVTQLEKVVGLKITEMSQNEEAVIRGKKILIAEDEQENRKNIITYLSARIPCRIDEAETGERALELIKENLYDVLITDINMPRISGLKVIEEVRSFQKDIAVIVITKWLQPGLEKDLQEKGIEYIPKPLSLKYLKERVIKKLLKYT